MSRKIIKKSSRYSGVYQYQKGKEKMWGYRLKYYDRSGKRKEKTGSGFADDREAYQHMIDIENNINKGNMHIVNPSKITIGQLLDAIIEEYKPNDDGVGFWSWSTYESYKKLRNNFIENTIGHIKVSEMTPALYRTEFINKFKDAAPASLDLYHRQITMIMNEGISREYIEKNKLKGIKLPKDSKEKEDRFLSTGELRIFLDGLDSKTHFYKTFFYLLAYSGVRIGEARALCWDDVNFERCTIKISKSIDQRYRVGATKGRNKRTIEIDSSIIDMLKTLRKIRMREVNINNKDFIFKADKNNLPISYTAVREITISYSDELINKKITPHYFRHTHASMLLMAGQSTKVVSERLGNSEQIIINDYSHVIPGMSISAVEAFNNEFGANAGAKTKVISIKS